MNRRGPEKIESPQSDIEKLRKEGQERAFANVPDSKRELRKELEGDCAHSKRTDAFISKTYTELKNDKKKLDVVNKQIEKINQKHDVTSLKEKDPVRQKFEDLHKQKGKLENSISDKRRDIVDANQWNERVSEKYGKDNDGKEIHPVNHYQFDASGTLLRNGENFDRIQLKDAVKELDNTYIDKLVKNEDPKNNVGKDCKELLEGYQKIKESAEASFEEYAKNPKFENSKAMLEARNTIDHCDEKIAELNNIIKEAKADTKHAIKEEAEERFNASRESKREQKTELKKDSEFVQKLEEAQVNNRKEYYDYKQQKNDVDTKLAEMRNAYTPSDLKGNKEYQELQKKSAELGEKMKDCEKFHDYCNFTKERLSEINGEDKYGEPKLKIENNDLEMSEKDLSDTSVRIKEKLENKEWTSKDTGESLDLIEKAENCAIPELEAKISDLNKEIRSIVSYMEHNSNHGMKGHKERLEKEKESYEAQRNEIKDDVDALKQKLMPVEPHETLEGQIIDEKNVKAFAVKACNKVGIVADLSVLDFNAPISMETVNYEYLATNGEKRNYSGKRFVFQSDVVSLGNVDVGKESEAKIFSIGDNQLSFRLQGSTSAKQFGVSEIFKKLGSQPVGISRLEIDPCQAKMELSLLPGLKLQMEIRNKRCKMIENMHKKNSDLQSSIEASSELKGALLSFEQSKWKNLDIEQKKELKDIDQAFQFVYENAPDFCNAKDEHESLLQDEIGIITEQVGKMLKNCDKCQRVKFHNLESIISSGQILSQTEGVRTSNGTYDPEMRREFSIHQYGRNMNEKYGYACLFSEEVNGKREGSINIYGNIILRFKPESVEDKITYFLGDTLAAKKYNFDTRPGVVGTENRETSLSASMHLNNQQILEVAKNGSMDPYDYVGERNYLEIQILGSLSLDDVSSIAFLEHEDYNNLSDDMKDILRKKEIELVFPSATKETEESV